MGVPNSKRKFRSRWLRTGSEIHEGGTYGWRGLLTGSLWRTLLLPCDGAPPIISGEKGWTSREAQFPGAGDTGVWCLAEAIWNGCVCERDRKLVEEGGEREEGERGKWGWERGGARGGLWWELTTSHQGSVPWRPPWMCGQRSSLHEAVVRPKRALWCGVGGAPGTRAC